MRLDHTKEMHFLDVILTPAYTHPHTHTHILVYVDGEDCGRSGAYWGPAFLNEIQTWFQVQHTHSDSRGPGLAPASVGGPAKPLLLLPEASWLIKKPSGSLQFAEE